VRKKLQHKENESKKERDRKKDKYAFNNRERDNYRHKRRRSWDEKTYIIENARKTRERQGVPQSKRGRARKRNSITKNI
jgi:hypothetical protein